MTSRSGLPSETETKVLLSSRRRCAICFGLNRDASVKQGQIAHLDRDRSNNKLENLTFLCLDHHDQYDSRMSQSKGLKSTELKYYRAELEEALRFAFLAPIELHKDQTAMKEWEGIFRWETANASAELQIFKSAKGAPDCYWVSGLAFWGTQNLYGPHTGDFDADAVLKGNRLVLKNQDYELSMALTGSGLSYTGDMWVRHVWNERHIRGAVPSCANRRRGLTATKDASLRVRVLARRGNPSL